MLKRVKCCILCVIQPYREAFILLSLSPHKLELSSHKMLTMTYISFGTIGIIIQVDPCRTAIRGGMSPLWFLHQGFSKVCIDIAVCKRHPILVLQVGTC